MSNTIYVVNCFFLEKSPEGRFKTIEELKAHMDKHGNARGFPYRLKGFNVHKTTLALDYDYERPFMTFVAAPDNKSYDQYEGNWHDLRDKIAKKYGIDWEKHENTRKGWFGQI